MAEHSATPGPWEYNANIFGQAGIIRAQGGVAIAAVLSNPERPLTGEAKANARLIALAPSLLEAAESLTQWIERYSSDMKRRGLCEAVAALVLAIGKAKGIPC